jgi:transporter family protein
MQKHILYSLAATLLWGVWAVLVKIASGRIGHWPSVMVYTIASVTTTLVIFTVLGKSLRGMDISGTAVAAAAGILGGLAIVFFQKALSVGPVSTSTALTALYPVLAVIFGVFFLKERLSPVNTIGIAMAVVAGILISL